MNGSDRRRYEDYYPRSRTGLGGLSLSSAGSSRVFRQDLAQTIAPLIVDPHSLTAVVKTSIQMPDHVFPTIVSVPGDMISFRYYVEVVIDLRGKTAGQDRFRPNFDIVNGPQHAYGDPRISKVAGADGVSYSTTPGFNYLITDQIRRTRGVVFTTNEIVVGTRDSARARGKQREGSDASNQEDSIQHSTEEQLAVDGDFHIGGIQSEPNGDHCIADNHPSHDAESKNYFDVPPPEIDSAVDEKARIRLAEQRLLPSSAPYDEGPSSGPAPSAPFAYDEEDFMNRYGLGAPAPAYEGPYNPSLEQSVSAEDTLDERSNVSIAPSIQDQRNHPSQGQPQLQDHETLTPGTSASSPRTIVRSKTSSMLSSGLMSPNPGDASSETVDDPQSSDSGVQHRAEYVPTQVSHQLVETSSSKKSSQVQVPGLDIKHKDPDQNDKEATSGSEQSNLKLADACKISQVSVENATSDGND